MLPASRPACLTLLSVFVLGLASPSCTTPPPSTGVEGYVPPPSGPTVAYLKGAEMERGGLFEGSHTAYVTMVDLRTVKDAAERGLEPLAISPGKRTIGVEYHHSNLMALAYLQLQARAGGTYQLMIKHGREAPDESRLFCEFWFVDKATGNPVTAVQHRQVSGGKTGTIFYINK